MTPSSSDAIANMHFDVYLDQATMARVEDELQQLNILNHMLDHARSSHQWPANPMNSRDIKLVHNQLGPAQSTR